MSTMHERLAAATHSYLAVCHTCLCAPAICVDTGDAETTKLVVRWLKDGYAVERHPHAEAVKRLGRCSEHKRKAREVAR